MKKSTVLWIALAGACVAGGWTVLRFWGVIGLLPLAAAVLFAYLALHSAKRKE